MSLSRNTKQNKSALLLLLTLLLLLLPQLVITYALCMFIVLLPAWQLQSSSGFCGPALGILTIVFH